MIFIVSSSREANALTGLCTTRSWPTYACTSVAELRRMLERSAPRTIITRQRLRDGYSDDILSLVRSSPRYADTKILVLIPAEFSSRQEARQLSLGADCTLRDPVRLEVLVEYLAKYEVIPERTAPQNASTPASPSYEFAGALIFPREQAIKRGNRAISVSPREIEFLDLLFGSAGQVVSYQEIYAELFSRNFAGDSANARVLLAKTADSFQELGVDLRASIQVVPKVGYKYVPSPQA